MFSSAPPSRLSGLLQPGTRGAHRHMGRRRHSYMVNKNKQKS
ncbi:rCG61846, partial [Rattus norvegicus]